MVETTGDGPRVELANKRQFELNESNKYDRETELNWN